jgi:hypothetical protein
MQSSISHSTAGSLLPTTDCGDGIVRRFAVVIGGGADSYAWSLTRNAAHVFDEHGYDVYLAAPSSSVVPKFTPFRTAPFRHLLFSGRPSADGVQQLVDRVAKRLDADDDLIVYLGWHGDRQGGGCLQLEDGCLEKRSPALMRLLTLPHGRLTILMDQCYSGDWADVWARDPTALFISSSSAAEFGVSGFSTYLLAPEQEVEDLNCDGVRVHSWQERYVHQLLSMGRLEEAHTQFISGRYYVDTGIGGATSAVPPPSNTVERADDQGAYLYLIKELMPGEIAVVGVFEPNASEAFTAFEQQAAAAAGKARFIAIPPESATWPRTAIPLEQAERFLVDFRGQVVVIARDEDPLEQRWRFTTERFDDPAYVLDRMQTSDALVRHPILDRIDPRLWQDDAFVTDAIAIDLCACGHASRHREQSLDCEKIPSQNPPIFSSFLERLFMQRD